MADNNPRNEKPALDIPESPKEPLAWYFSESTKVLAESPSKRGRSAQDEERERLGFEERLTQAQTRREEFRSWVLKKAQTKKPTRKNPEERRAARLEKLRERQLAAEVSREAALEAVRTRAATFLARREGALARVNERQESLASRVFESLAAADERRSALQEAEKERLKAEHDNIVARLATNRAEAPPELEEARKKLEDRLLAAEEARAASLAQIAARAGEQVQHARDVSALTRQLKLEALAAKRASAEARMVAARQRRAMLGQSVPSLTPPSPSPCPSPAPSLAVPPEAVLSTGTQATASTTIPGGFGSTSSLPDLPATLGEGPTPEQVAQEARALEQAVAEAEIAGAEAEAAEREVAAVVEGVGEPPQQTATEAKVTPKRPAPQSFPISMEQDDQEFDMEMDGSDAAGSDADDSRIQERAQEMLESRMEAFRRSCSTRKLQAAWRTFAHKRRTTDALARAFVETGAISTRLKAALRAQEQAKPMHSPLSRPPQTPQGEQPPSASQQQQQQQAPPSMVVGAPGLQSSRGGPHQNTLLDAAKGLDSFDAFASTMQAPRTLRATSALLHRLEARLILTTSGGAKGDKQGEKEAQHSHTGGGASQKSVNKLLRRLFPSLPKDRALERYPPRIFLCALMIQHYPEVVFSASGPREAALAEAARDMTAAFDDLVLRILEPSSAPPSGSLPPKPPPSPHSKPTPTSSDRSAPDQQDQGGVEKCEEEQGERAGGVPIKGRDGVPIKGRSGRQVHEEVEGSSGSVPGMVAASPVARSMQDYRRAVAGGGATGSSSAGATVGQLLVRFDEAWLRYLDQFAAWKLEDAASLEAELVRVAADMERSMQRKLARSRAAVTAAATGTSPQGSPVSQHSFLLHARSARNLDSLSIQVAHDHRLLRERIARLSGQEGIARLDRALTEARAQVAQEAIANDWESDMDYVSEAPSDSEHASLASSPRRPLPTTQRDSPTSAPIPTSAAPTSTAPPPPATAQAASTPTIPTPSAPSSTTQPPTVTLPTHQEQQQQQQQQTSQHTPQQTSQAQPQFAPTQRRSVSGIRRGFFGGPPSGAGAAPTAAPTPAAAAPVPMVVSDVRAPSAPALSQSAQPAAGYAGSAYSPSGGSTRSSSPGRSSASPGAYSGSGASSPGGMATPGGLGSGSQAGLGDSISNLQLVWEVVHNPKFSLGSGEAEAAWERACLPEEEQQKLPTLLDEDLEREGVDAAVKVVRARAAAIAETAFWDAVTERIQSGLMGNNLASVVVPLLSQLGTDLAGVLSDPNAASTLRSEFGEEALNQSVSSGASGGGTGGVLRNAAGALQRGAQLLIQYGAPFREEDCKAAHASFQAEVVSAMEAWGQAAAGEDRGALEAASARMARSLARALRLLLAQLKLLKLDSANARFAGLARQMQGQAGIDYLRTKFASLHRIPLLDPPSGPAPGPEVHGVLAQRLPRTTAWLTNTANAATGVRGYLTSVGLDVDAPQVQRAARQSAEAAATATTAQLPSHIRSGLRSGPVSAGASSTNEEEAQSTKIQPVVPVTLGSWRGRVRGGIVALIAAEVPAVSPALAETLAWDAERLHSAQNAFQQLVVVTAGMLLVQQTRAAAGRPAWDAAQTNAARQRLMVVLADPSMDLADLVSELTRLSRMPPSELPSSSSPGNTGEPQNAPGSAPGSTASTAQGTAGTAQATAGAAGSAEEEERSMRRAFSTLMSTNGAAFRSISNAIAAALAVRLLLGPAAVDSPVATQGSQSSSAELAARHAVTHLLGRVGAASLAPDVAALARKLLAVCAVSEAVHGSIYAALAPQDDDTQSASPNASGRDDEGPRGGATPVTGTHEQHSDGGSAAAPPHTGAQGVGAAPV